MASKWMTVTGESSDSSEDVLYPPITPIWSRESPVLESILDVVPGGCECSQREERCCHRSGPVLTKQEPRRCVATCLAMLTGLAPSEFFHVDKDDPVSWSNSLVTTCGKKLAYCNTVPTSFMHYVPELLELNGVFLVGLYTGEKSEITGSLLENGTNGCSHLVLLYGRNIYDPSGPKKIDVREDDFHYSENRVKRIFRVVPADYTRGI